MGKKCYIYEQLNNVNEMNMKKDDKGLLHLSGTFGVCGIKNNNQRIYQYENYKKMVDTLNETITKNGGVPGEMEHPNTMNIDLNKISHKITKIGIDENGVVSGEIVLLNTPKGQIAQAIVEGGLPLFVSSRAMGDVDADGKVTLEMLATYDLVGTPGFSEAQMHLNESQQAHQLCESLFYVENKQDDMNENLTEEVKALKETVKQLQEQLQVNNRRLCESTEKWVISEVAPEIQKWVVEQIMPGVQKWVVKEYSNVLEGWIMKEILPGVQNWVVESFAPEIQKWVVEQYSPEVQKWVVNEYSSGVQKWFTGEYANMLEDWISEEYSGGVEKWITEHFAPELGSRIQNWTVKEFAPEVQKWVIDEYSPTIQNYFENESPKAKRKDTLETIDETLKMLENCEIQPKSKPTFESRVNSNEPIFVQNMPATARVKWNMASDNVKANIMRRAKVMNLTNESAIENFWNTCSFEEPAAPVTPITENFNGSVYENGVRAQLRAIREKYNGK